ncbi:exosome complex exonuclease Rrp41 [Candidatus Micrarchaeota archaeon]|nr:exosome complex exonuclease Rrp41 [Candidatus Micrarchaeota archaeon]
MAGNNNNPNKPKLRDGGRRISGRGDDELRPMSIEVGPMVRPEGSAIVNWGRNKVLAAVYGPREVFPKHLTDPHKALINARYIMAPFSGQEEHGRAGPNRRSIEVSKVIKHVFENNVLVHSFPKTTVDLMLEVLQSDGGTRVSAINAASVALVDAGIPIRDIVSAVSVGKADGKMVVDLDKDEDNWGESDMPLAFSVRTGEMLLFQMDGMLTLEELSTGIDLGFEAAKKVRAIQTDALVRKYAIPGESAQ